MKRTVAIQELSDERFHIYGSFADMLNPNSPKIGTEPVEFYRDMVFQTLGASTEVAFSVTHSLKRPNVIDSTEIHRKTGESMLPLDGDVLIHVGIAMPNGIVPLDKIEVFRVPRGTVVTIRPGVWHGAPFVVNGECVNTLIVLPERIYADDCFVFTIAEDDRIIIK